jgi:hypothetical protein
MSSVDALLVETSLKAAVRVALVESGHGPGLHADPGGSEKTWTTAPLVARLRQALMSLSALDVALVKIWVSTDDSNRKLSQGLCAEPGLSPEFARRRLERLIRDLGDWFAPPEEDFVEWWGT